MTAPAAARYPDGTKTGAEVLSLTGASRQALMGFFLIGMLVALPGALLPAWGYHFRPAFESIGGHFLALTAGILVTLRLARRILTLAGAQRTMIASCIAATAGIGLMGLTVLPDLPESLLLRNFGLFLAGIGSGGLMAATFQLLQPLYEHDSAATVNLSAGLMGLGCLLPSSLSALAYSLTGFVGLFWLLALPPAFVALALYRGGRSPEPPLPDLGFREVFAELRSPVHVLFAALLCFQTAAELSVAGWTSIHLILRVGMSPSASLYFLSFFWFCLLIGRILAQSLLLRVPPRRVLLASAAMAWLGILLLAATDNRFGAVLGLGLTGLGFAFVYPLLVERIGSRFQSYHASLFHGIFGIGMMAGFLAPALIGWVAAADGVGWAMIVPLGASFMVFLLLLAIWVESKFSPPTAAPARDLRG